METKCVLLGIGESKWGEAGALFPFSLDFHYNRRGKERASPVCTRAAPLSQQVQEVKPDIRRLRIAAWVMTR
jgi:hypothetical protein